MTVTFKDKKASYRKQIARPRAQSVFCVVYISTL